MASKQIGKFRQRVGEIVSRGGNKTALSEEFSELESDVQIRSAGLERMTVVTDAYIRSLTKKKKLETDPSLGEFLAVDGLGTVMVEHGEEFADESVYGNALVSFGRVHCKIASLQEDYASALQDTFVSKLEDGVIQIKEYQAMRKKLDSRRLALDSFLSKASKAKKEKDKAEAEEEVEVAKVRFVEMEEEVHARMLAIQNREAEQFAHLTEFLDLEIAYSTAYFNALIQLRDEWPEANSIQTKKPDLHHRRSFVSSPQTTRPPPPTRARESHDSDRPPSPPTRRRSHTTSESVPTISTPKPPKHTRKRSDSQATTETTSSAGAPANGGIRSNVSGWMGSLSRSRKSSVSKKNFRSLDDDEDRSMMPPPTSSFSSLNLEDVVSTKNNSPVGSVSGSFKRAVRAPLTRSSQSHLRPETAAPRIRALHDLSTSASDELEFRAGDVLNVVDPDELADGGHGWIRAEKDGVTGLVPFNYFELVAAPPSPRKSVSRAPSLRHHDTESGTAEDTEESDSPSSSLLQDNAGLPISRRGSMRRALSRSKDYDAHESEGLVAPRNLPPVYNHPFDDSSSVGETDDYSISRTDYSAPSKADAWSSQPRIEEPPTTTPYRSITAPPSPVRPPIPAPSPRQLASSLASGAAAVAAGKRPPPPPPPARRTQSSALLSTSAAGTHTPPVPPPRRPAIPPRSQTATTLQTTAKSPFDP